MARSSVDDLSEIFLKIVEAPPDRQQALLQELCPNEETRDQIRKLLAVDQSADPLLDHTLIPESIGLKAGDCVADYQLLRELAHGGMGIVFLAEQLQPIRRDVALKVIKPGVDTREVIARFNAERQALSLMDHPNIAKVLDAGATETGRPFFVMELVDGQPITSYCQQNRLSIDQRLRLFVSVCRAIQHAHHKGVIHRDIKPSNVMVAEYDGQPVAKVIDFGVAKAMDQTLSTATVATGIGQIIGTIDYMSPEQSRLNDRDIDTRSDIYSLGVLLYELLTDTPPFDRERLRSADFDELLKILQEEDPPGPSARLKQLQKSTWSDSPTKLRDDEESSLDSTSETFTTRTERQNGRHLRQRERAVRGELDWIVFKAMDKDRNRRYSTPDELAVDVERFLTGQAVSACPPSALYLCSKFARRHKTAFATTGLVGLAVVLGIVGIAYQTLRASRAEAKANKEAFEFIIEIVLGSGRSQASAGYSPDPNLTLTILLKNVKDRVEQRFADEPEIQAKMKSTVADLLHNVGQYDDAAGLYDDYYEFLIETKGPSDQDTILALRDRMEINIRKSRFEKAADLGDEALGYSRRFLGKEHEITLMILDDLAMLYHKQSRNQKAVEAYQQVLEVRQRILGVTHPDSLATKSSLATVYETLEQFDVAKRLHSDVLQNYQEMLSPIDARLAAASQKLGKWYLASGRRNESREQFVQAAELLREALNIYDYNRGKDHTDTLNAKYSLAQVEIELLQLGDALPLLEDFVTSREKLGIPNDRMTLEAKNLLGWTYLNKDLFAEAEYELNDAYGQLRDLDSPSELQIQVMGNLAIVRYRMGKIEEAVALDVQTAKESAQTLGKNHRETLASHARLNVAYRALGRNSEAKASLREVSHAAANHPEAIEFVETQTWNQE